ncbi:MAG: peptidoglycan-binding domain-containing protein [Elainellaceae cyanobacterium]
MKSATTNTDLPLITLYEGDRGSNVTKLQAKLASLDLYPKEPTGYFDVLTGHALRTIQRMHGLTETGCFDTPTWYALTFWDCWS